MDQDGYARILDGYGLIRFIGRGGFGEVWLCRSETMGDFRALKLISTSNPELLSKEYESLVHYRKAAALLRCPDLVPIEHVNRIESALFYVMPLADGVSDQDPSDEEWKPQSLSSLIQTRKDEPSWFSSKEVIALILPILRGLQTLTSAGLVHRDVKPDNILFFNGAPCLGDISLMGADASEITRRGTPGYATPTWYVGGHPDMFGVAASLYSILTGNSPDKMGRTAFIWPPLGEESLSPIERAEWKRIHAVIRRATDEKVSERYLDFTAMADALSNDSLAELRPKIRPKSKPLRVLLALYSLMGIAAATLAVAFHLRQDRQVNPKSEVTNKTPVKSLPELTPEQLADYTAHAGLIQGYIGDGQYANALASVENLLSTYPQSRSQPAYSLARATALAGLKRYEEAKEELRKDVNLSSQITAMAGRKDLWLELGDLEGAEKDITRVLDKFGPNSFALFLRADVKAQRDDFAGVVADKHLAYDIKKNDPAQRKLVDLMWTPLAEKYPAFGDYLKFHPEPADNNPAPSPEPSKFADEDDEILKVFDDILVDLIEPASPVSDAAIQARKSTKERIRKELESANYARALHTLDEVLYSLTELHNNPAISLFRAALLRRLDRPSEVEQELRKPCHYNANEKAAEARTVLLEDLHREKDAVTLLTQLLEGRESHSHLSGEKTIVLLHLRSKARVALGDFAGAHEDFHEALKLAETAFRGADGDNLHVDPDDLKQMGDMIRQTWLSLQESYPGYKAYVATLHEK